MTKKLKILAMFTGVCVAVCTAVLTSCTKENEVINDVPAMEMKSGLGGLSNDNYVLARIRLEYRQVDKNGREYCYYRPKKREFCNMDLAVSYHDFSFPVSIKMDQNGVVKSLSINEIDMPSEDKPTFEDCVLAGTISFASDSPICDSALQAVLANDYIAAGKYPIQKINDVYVITISI